MKETNQDKIKELPESAYDFLLTLWARSHNVEIVDIKKSSTGTQVMEEAQEAQKNEKEEKLA